MTGRARFAAAVLVLAGAAGCGGAGGPGEQVLTVYAAASLTEPFTALARTFEQQHDGVRVRLGFGGSSDLATQIVEGAPADVLASADEATMERLSEEGLVEEHTDVASNRLTIAVPSGNPAGVRTLADLEDVDLVVCAPVVPCGAAAQQVADRAGVALSPVSEEQSVTDVLGKVLSGEADAGLVYVTDVLAADGAVEGIALPGAHQVVNTYPVATLADAEDPALAEEFVAMVAGERGRSVLAEAGFGPP